MYEALNPSHFNDELNVFVQKRESVVGALSLSLRTASDGKSPAFDDSCYDHENNLDDVEFDSIFAPEEMRCLALVAHNHMKPAMREFVEKNKNVLKKFRLTGTNTTMIMLREVFGDDDPDVRYGPTCQSGPLGGDAELVALMVMEELGGMIFLQDPMDAHPHRADIDCLNRQANVHDIVQASNPASAYGMMGMFRMALRAGDRGLLASFFETEYSPSVLESKRREREMKSALGTEVATGSTKRASACEVISAELAENAAQAAAFLANVESKNDEEKAIVSTMSSINTMPNSIRESVRSIQTENAAFRSNRQLTEAIAERGSNLYQSVSDDDFKSMFHPKEMRLLALVAQSNMLPALRKFIFANKNLLKKFVLTGNKDTMKFFSDVYKGDTTVKFGPVCQSGSLGGNAQLCALMCLDELGGLVYLQDPMDTHPYQADIDCVNRQCNVHDIYYANNISSAYLMTSVLRRTLKIGNYDRIGSFFETRKSPSVAEYKRRQKAVSDKLSKEISEDNDLVCLKKKRKFRPKKNLRKYLGLSKEK